MTETEFNRYLQAFRAQPPPPPPTEAELAERHLLLDKVKQISVMLKSRFGAQRVILFGSLAHQTWFSPRSDVDLAVEGVPDESYWRAWAMAEEILSERLIDFVPLEDASPGLRRAIARDGVEL